MTLFISEIAEGRKLLIMDMEINSDPYVSLRLKSQDLKDVQKTQVISNTCNPIWNQEFDIFAEDMNDVLLINMYNEDVKDDAYGIFHIKNQNSEV